jgi:hypothetical protein
MLIIAGAVTLTHIFPADLETTMMFYDGLDRLAEYLPHIEIVDVQGPGQFRMVYSATEMGGYHIRIYTDVKSELRLSDRQLMIMPTQEYKPIPQRATFNSSVGQGYYASESLFWPEAGNRTRVEFRLELRARLPRPKGLRFMPAAAVKSIVDNMTERRVNEIANGFISNSLAAFPTWKQSRNSHAF